MAAPTVVEWIICPRDVRFSRCGALRFRASTEASGPPPWVLQARCVPLPEPDRGFRNPDPTPTERRARLPVRGVFVFGGTQS